MFALKNLCSVLFGWLKTYMCFEFSFAVHNTENILDYVHMPLSLSITIISKALCMFLEQLSVFSWWKRCELITLILVAKSLYGLKQSPRQWAFRGLNMIAMFI
ncbi:hypothetical protein ACJX0J_017164 [Zea mays]